MSHSQFLRTLVMLNGAVPLVMLAWDAYRGQLGANSINTALHITGLLSLVFLFLTLLMSPMKWATGWGGWIAFRRGLGLYGFFYAVVHLAIYVCFDRALSLSSTLNEIWMRRFLQIGAVAILLMVPLAVTSTNGMIQRMGPRRWKLLHRSAYVVAILGVLHYYMLVKSDVRQPLAFAGVLAVLLGGRFGRHYFQLLQIRASRLPPRPATPSGARVSAPDSGKPDLARLEESRRPSSRWKGELRVAAMFGETPDVKTFRLAASDGGPLPFTYQPGQFVNVEVVMNTKRVTRSYTLASSPTRRDFCELTIKRAPMGTVSRLLHDQFQVGDLVTVSGPSGRFTFAGDESPSVLLIAGGVGMTPLMSIVRYLTDRTWFGDVYFVIVAKTEQDLIFHDELQWLQRRFSQLHVCVTLTRCHDSSPWPGERGRANGPLLERFVPNLSSIPVYLCGPHEMMDATRTLLREIGVPDAHVRTEAFAGKKSGGVASIEREVTSTALKESVGQSVDAVRSPEEAKATSSVRFTRTNVQAETSGGTILEVAEASAITIPFECRSGFCGQCRTRLLEGQIQMDSDEALTPVEKAAGWILACQARPKSHVVVDA